jgi:aerobic C4-dicarboxylate transport protein
MSECRSLTNFIGNAVATVVVSRWEGKLDQQQLALALNGGVENSGVEFAATQAPQAAE